MLLAIASLLFFLLVAVLDHWVFNHGLGFAARLVLFAVWVAAAGRFCWRFVLPPLANRINPVFAAQTIEQGRPTLKNSLINFLMLRSHPQDVATVVFYAMEHRAAADLLKVPVDHAVDRGRMVHLAFILAAVVASFALYLAISPKNPLVSAARVLWPWSSIPAPTRVHIDEVRPGEKIVFNDDREPNLRPGDRPPRRRRSHAPTQHGRRPAGRRSRHHDPCRRRQPLSLRIAAGQRRFSARHVLSHYRRRRDDATIQLEVHIAPTILIDRIDYHFPAYTGQPDRTVKNQGDIKALEGTHVTIHAKANMDIREAHIDLGCAGLQLLPMKTDGRMPPESSRWP